MAPVDTLTKLVAGWLLGYSNAHTRAAYRRDVGDFATWAGGHDVELLSATRAVIDAYARTLETAGARPATVARRLATLASFYRYALDEAVIDRNPLDRVRRPKPPRDSTTLGLDRDQATAFLHAAATAGPRDHLLALLLAVNALRVSEALALDLDDLETVRGHSTVVIAGKGGREDRIALPPVTTAAIHAVIATESRDTGPMLADHTGGRLNRHQATRIVKRLARAAGVPVGLSPHGLRHTCVTAALDAGVSLRDVQDLARHADPRTTRRYDRSRGALDRHASYAVAAFLAASDTES